MNKTRLSVNMNKIALLRNSRGSDYPSVLEFAQMAVDAGAEGITVHPRPDQRHIRVDDVQTLSQYTASLPDIEFNIEGNPFAPAEAPQGAPLAYPGLMKLIEAAKPEQATLVPDNRGQLTSDHGFDIKQEGERLKPILAQLKSWQVRSSLFMDPDLEQIRLAKDIGADAIELYTGPYAWAYGSEQGKALLQQYRQASDYAQEIGLAVNAGHDLNLENLADFLTIPGIAEVSIGHALTVDGLLLGYKNAIKAYSQICL